MKTTSYEAYDRHGIRPPHQYRRNQNVELAAGAMGQGSPRRVRPAG